MSRAGETSGCALTRFACAAGFCVQALLHAPGANLPKACPNLQSTPGIQSCQDNSPDGCVTPTKEPSTDVPLHARFFGGRLVTLKGDQTS